jgi:hypothetical protein
LRKVTSSSGDTAASMPNMDSARRSSANSQDTYGPWGSTPSLGDAVGDATLARDNAGLGPWNQGLAQTASMPSLGRRSLGESSSPPGTTESAGPADGAWTAGVRSNSAANLPETGSWSSVPLKTGPVRTGRNLTSGAIAELLPEPPGPGSLDRHRSAPAPNSMQTSESVADACRNRGIPSGIIKELSPDPLGSSRQEVSLAPVHSQTSSTTTAPPKSNSSITTAPAVSSGA